MPDLVTVPQRDSQWLDDHRHDPGEISRARAAGELAVLMGASEPPVDIAATAAAALVEAASVPEHGQITREALDNMTAAEIVQARKAGRLNDVLGIQSN